MPEAAKRKGDIMIGRGHGRTYKVNIEDLLTSLKKNRDEHVEIVEEAQAAFRDMAIKRLDSMLRDAKSGKGIRTRLGLDVPSIHTDAFDNAIGLMEMTQRAGETTIEIDSGEYERFVRNNWEWTQEFTASNARYSNKLGN
jgi:hypothetical protein